MPSVTLAADVPLTGRSRLIALFRGLYLVPVAIAAGLYGGVASLATIAAWLAVLWTGRYPPGLYDFNVKALRMLGRGFAYALLTTDEMPPLDGEPADAYPIRIDLPPPRQHHDRREVALLPLRAIPLIFIGAIKLGIATVLGFAAALMIVLTGTLPAVLVPPIRDLLTWQTHALAHIVLFTADRPALSLALATAPDALPAAEHPEP